MMAVAKFLVSLFLVGAGALDNGIGKLPKLGFNSKC
jgi:hypothetical protein